MSRVFVGGLAWATTREGLQAAFEEFGTVQDCIIMTDRETGRSRGFGFVTMGSEEEANKVVEMLDGQNLDGRNVKVNIAQSAGGGGRGGGGGGWRGGNQGGGGYGRGGGRSGGRDDWQ